MIFKQHQIDNFLKKPDTKYRAVLIYGSNDGLVAEYTNAFIKSVSPDMFDPFLTAYFEMDKISADKSALIAEYNAQSLMGGRRVIIIKDADDSLAKLMPQILESNSDSLLVLASTSLKKKSSLVALAEEDEKIICVPCYEDRDDSIYSSTRQKLIDEGYTITQEALQLLCSKLSADRKTNLGEIEKLITYVGSKKDISPKDVMAVIGDLSTLGTDDLVFGAAGGDTTKALNAYYKILKEGIEVVPVIRALYYHFYRIIQCRALIESGQSMSSAMAKLRPPVMFFLKPEFESQLAFWKKEKLFEVVNLLYKAERDCKTTGMPAEQILEFTIMQISSAAKKLRNPR